MPTQEKIKRPPVIAVLGHVDHGKSSLLDKIRETNTTDSEVGGITQCLSGYEKLHHSKETNEDRFITFLDTPGHEAFTSIRERGTSVADVVILVVSAEDGVMPQTKEVIDCLFATKTPFVVAINKIDTSKADVQRTKKSLAENGVFVEDYSGDVPSVAISAKTGEGIPELLDMILLLADMEELNGDPNDKASGQVVESTTDPKKGTAALLIIKNGTLKTGDMVVSEDAYSPVRQIQIYDGSTIEERSFSSPVFIAGWNKRPRVGAPFYVVETKKEAEKQVKEFSGSRSPESTCPGVSKENGVRNIPIILKADSVGSIEAIQQEVKKIEEKDPDINITFLTAEASAISEKDVQNAGIDPKTLLIGFNTTIYPPAKRVSENIGVEPVFFSIIYELVEWLDEHIKKTKEPEEKDKEHGRLKILKNFSSSKKGQVLGGKVTEGEVAKDDRVKVIRNEETISQGRIKGIQQQKVATKSVGQGQECGILLDSPTDVSEGDILSAFTTVKE
ncbi:MAG: translation initiation factor IF-2 [Candidatus Paceibacterota bacterium]